MAALGVICQQTPEAVIPTFEDVVFQSNWDGAHDAQTATDYSALAAPLTFYGTTVRLTSAFKEFGTAGLYNNALNDSVRTPPNDAYTDLMAGDFTIEFWFRPNSVGTSATFQWVGVWEWNNSPAMRWRIVSDTGTMRFQTKHMTLANAFSTWLSVSLAGVPLTDFTHVAVCRYRGQLRMFFDGVMQDKELMQGDHSITPSSVGLVFMLGCNGVTDDIRITRGAWYRSDLSFTPPIEAFTFPSFFTTAGTSTMLGVGSATVDAIGEAHGTSTAEGQNALFPEGDFTGTGTSTAHGSGSGIWAAHATATGTSTAPAAGSFDIYSPLFGLTDITAAWSLSRNLVGTYAGAKYSDTSGAITQIHDQAGSSDRHWTDGGTAARRPTLTTAGPNSVTCADFDGSSDVLATNGAATVHLVSAASSMICVSVIFDAFVNNDATIFLNDCILSGESGTIGLHARNTAGGTVYAVNHDGSFQTIGSTVTTATPYVIHLRHHGGTLYLGINGVEVTSTSSGNTINILTGMGLGGRAGTTPHANMKFFEAFTSTNGNQDFSNVIADMMAHIGA